MDPKGIVAAGDLPKHRFARYANAGTYCVRCCCNDSSLACRHHPHHGNHCPDCGNPEGHYHLALCTKKEHPKGPLHVFGEVNMDRLDEWLKVAVPY